MNRSDKLDAVRYAIWMAASFAGAVIFLTLEPSHWYWILAGVCLAVAGWGYMDRVFDSLKGEKETK